MIFRISRDQLNLFIQSYHTDVMPPEPNSLRRKRQCHSFLTPFCAV